MYGRNEGHTHMATEKQIAANRRNAQHSTGPRTEAGRTRSRLNAFRHGLTGQLDILPDDLKEAHDAFVARMLLSLAPADDPLETQLAHSIAESYWRLNRIPIVENVLLLDADYVRSEFNRDKTYSDLHRTLSSVRALIENPQRFGLLTVYEMRLHRKSLADLKQLRQLQAERSAKAEAERSAKEAERKAKEEADRKLARQAAAVAPQPAESTDPPQANGFVFSAAAPNPPSGAFANFPQPQNALIVLSADSVAPSGEFSSPVIRHISN